MILMMREVISNRLAAVSIRDLLLVEAVALHCSFRHAATVMGISASGISFQVKKVEEILGKPIFERGNKVTPTAYGHAVLDVIAVILAGITRLEGLRDGPSLPFGQVLRIGVISSLSPSDLLCVIESCQYHSNQTKLEVVSGKHHGLLRRLQDREIDLLVTASRQVPEGLAYAALYREGFVLLNRSDTDGPGRDVISLSTSSILPFSEDDFVPERIATGLNAALNSILTRTYGLGVAHRIALVSAGYGLALLPRGWAQAISSASNTRIIGLPPDLSDERTIGCLWRQSFTIGSEIAQALRHGLLGQEAASDSGQRPPPVSA